MRRSTRKDLRFASMTITLVRITDLAKGTREALATLRFQRPDKKRHERDSRMPRIEEAPFQTSNGQILKLSAVFDTTRQKLSLGIVGDKEQALMIMMDWVGSAAFCFFRFESDAFELYLEKEDTKASTKSK